MLIDSFHLDACRVPDAVDRRRLTAGALAAALVSVVALSIPLFRGYFPAGHDATAHLTYTFLFDRALEEGQFPVRWVEGVVSGYGQPLFSFYQPGLYYLVALIHLAVPSLSSSLMLAVAVLWWLGTLFVFLLARRFGILPAAAAAVVYAFSPYLIVDVFVRSAFPEFAAIAFAPGVLLAMDALMRRPSGARLARFSVLCALLLVCHPPSALIFTPVFVIYAIYLLLARQARAGTVLWVAGGGVLALGAAGFYIVPAIIELDLIDRAALTAGSFDYRQHFVWPDQWLSREWGYGASVEGRADEMPFQVGVLQIGVLSLGAIGTVLSAARTQQPESKTKALLCWLVAVSFGLFLMTPWSAPVWAVVPGLPFVQYPWRFLMVVPVCAGMIAAILLSAIPSHRVQAAVVIACVVLAVQFNHEYLKPGGYVSRAALDIDQAEGASSPVASDHAFVERAYFPRSVRDMPPPVLERWTLAGEGGSISSLKVSGHELVLRANLDEPTDLVINTFLFPGWRVSVDGEDTPISRDASGYMRIHLPAGVHRVHARFTETPARFWGNAATLTSLLVGGALFAVRRPRVRDWAVSAPDVRDDRAARGGTPDGVSRRATPREGCCTSPNRGPCHHGAPGGDG